MPLNSRRQASFSRLAAGQVASRRSDIMLAATDTFCSLTRPDKTQVDQFRELFYSLISETDEAAKRLIASALSKHYYAPRQILLYLAMEDAAIAAPILAYSKSLGQFDLLQIIDKTSNLHHRVIANRDDLGKTVISKLAELEDYLVSRRLEDNPAIDLANMRTSKPKAKDVMELPKPELAKKSNDVANALDRMNVILKNGKAQISDLMIETDQTDVISEPAATRDNSTPQSNKIKLAMDELITLANRGRRLGSVEDLLSELPVDENIPFAERLLQATIRKSRQDQVTAIQQELSLSAESARSVFADRSGDTMSVCLKAANVETKTALEIITHSILNVGLSAHNTQRISKIYPALNQQACLETVKTWSGAISDETPTFAPATIDDGRVEWRNGDYERAAPQAMPQTGERKLFGT